LTPVVPAILSVVVRRPVLTLVVRRPVLSLVVRLPALAFVVLSDAGRRTSDDAFLDFGRRVSKLERLVSYACGTASINT